MSDTMTSAWAPNSLLYGTTSGQGLIQTQQNALNMQKTQQDVGMADMSVVGRAAASLLGMQEDQAAAAYGPLKQSLQAQGFGKNLPDQYPGHATAQAFVQRALSVPEQYQYGLISAPGGTQDLQDIYSGRGKPGATGDGAATAPGTTGDGLTGDREKDRAIIVKRESGGDPTALNYVAQQDPTAYARGATASGKYQFVNSTWAEGMQLAGLDPAQYPTARSAPEAVQDKVFDAVYAKYGNKPWQKGTNDWIKDESGQYQLASVRPSAPPAVPGVPGTPGQPAPYQVATAGNTVPPPPGGAPGAAAVPPPAAVDLTGPRPLPPSGPGSAVATPASLANTPLMVPRNALAPPAPAPVPPAPAVSAATPAVPAPAASPTAPALPRMADVPTGLNRPQVQQAQELLTRATQIELRAAQSPMDKVLQAKAAAMAADLKQRAQTLMTTDTVVQTQEGQLHTLTGAVDKTAAPLPNYVYNPTQHAYIDTTGTNKPEFEPAQRDSAVAQRDVMELGPKVAHGTATPEEQARYATAAETYRQPVLRENPVTKETVRVNTRELPAGFPEPPGLGGGAPGAPGSQVVMPGYSPAQQQVERDPAAYKVSETQYTNDAQDIRPLAEAGRQAQADQVRLHEMQDVLQRFSTGSGTDARTAAAAFFQRWLPSAITGWEKQSANLSGSDAAQAFSKLALVGAGTQERGVLGARGGYQAIKLFKDANPNVDLNDATNKSILDMQMITNQANQDYTQAALSHFADNEKKFGATHQYDSLNQFDRNWNAQRNPQVYSAAMGAISGQPYEQWSKGLQEPEIKRALDIVSRANPSATVNGRSGRLSMQPTGGQGIAAPVQVQTPAAATALPPGTPYVTPDGRRFTR